MSNSDVFNHLVSTLPDASRRRIERELEPTDMPRDFVIASRGHQIDFTYFLDAGIGSVTLTNRKGHVAEAGMFGREGVSPTALAAGGYVSLYDIAMQSKGRGHRIDSQSPLLFWPRTENWRTCSSAIPMYSRLRSLSQHCLTPWTGSVFD